jgi:APA family basic amino acid/polyamine antiporter
MSQLERSLHARDLVLIVVGTVIGSGIFLVPGAVLRQTGGELGPALLVWLVAGILSVLGALTYGELGAMSPEVGGLYVYVRDAFGALIAFLCGWAMFFVIGSGAIATLAVAFSAYLGQIVAIGPSASRLVSLAMIAAVAAINVRGTRQSARVQGWATALKAGAIVVMGVVLLAAGEGEAGRLWPDSTPLSLLTGMGIGLVGVLWAYEGWQYVTFSAGEADDPQRSFPRGIIVGTAALVALYLLANVGYIAALGTERATRSERIASDAMGAVLGPGAARLVAAVILVSIFSAANGVALTTTRVYFAMARDGVFFRGLARVHPRFGTPALAVLACCAWAMLLAATGTFDQLLTYVVFVAWVFYALGGAALFYYRRRRPDAPRPFRVPGYPWTPIAFVLSALAIVANTLVTQPQRALVGIGLVLLGVPAFFVWKARRPEAPSVAAAPASSR